MRSNSDEVEMRNDCYAIYTSPPPAAEPLLKEKPLKGSANLKRKIIILLCVMIGIVMLVSLIDEIRYPISLKIKSNDVATAKIIFYGDGIDKEITEQKDVKKLVRALNKLRFKESEYMGHLSPRSGIRIVELYDEDGECIECVQFYDWAYRGGEYKDEERKNGDYLSVKKGLRLGDFYILCDKLCDDPFDMGIYKIFYYLQ